MKSPTPAVTSAAAAAVATDTHSQPDARSASVASRPDSPCDGLSKSRLSRPLFTPLTPPLTDHEPPVIEGVQQFAIDPDFDYDNCPCSSRFGSESVEGLSNVTS